MAEEALLKFFKASLPEELSSLLQERIIQLEECDFGNIFEGEDAQSLLGKKEDFKIDDSSDWGDFVSTRLEGILNAAEQGPKGLKETSLFIVGYAALLAFIQSNITGPPLPFSSAAALLPESVSGEKNRLGEVRRHLLQSLSVDGIGAFRLTPNVELLVLSKAILENERVVEAVGPVAVWGRLRARQLHQRLLNEVSGSLETAIYRDLDDVEEGLFSGEGGEKEAKVQFLLERATVETWCGMDKKAREDLDAARTERGFLFALTGLLGRRTKFQRHDVSQLVVLARSVDGEDAAVVESKGKGKIEHGVEASGPKNLDLNDDTLLESISFTEKPAAPMSTDVREIESLPKELTDLDPSNQPLLKPLDSIILLALASSITNTSPANGLTREETVPYAVRVLEGGSSNWQVYTQALLVRSRMEGYRSRTIERGLLQLQTVVDQVIADTASPSDSTNTDAAPTTFLPQGTDSAPASERLRYIFQLASPSRWELEAELAQRWVSLGGLRSALEIYERLEMWAEAALCYAATEKEETAKRMVRRQLFHATSGVPDTEASEDEKWEGEVRDPAPADAPRFYCILGDVDNDPTMYEKAWEVSNQRYARAQRSLGRYWLSQHDHLKAADAYAKSLKANSLNHQSWFALGCSLLELAAFEKAAESFRRCVQLDETDAEAWSNLAAALLKNEVPEVGEEEPAELPTPADDEEDIAEVKKQDPQQNRLDALRALKRAATLKHDSHRIWENLLIISASVYPPDYTSIITAQRHLIDLRGKTVGEKCVDVEIMGLMVTHIITNNETFDKDRPGYERMLVDLFDKHITPLITGSQKLWQLVGKLALWRAKPEKALDAHEKAWRAVTTQPGWETESVKRWDRVVDATIELCDAYESLGPREKTDGLAAGSLVAKDWKFKARSAIRGIMGRGRDSWEDTEGWERLKDALDQLKG